MEEKQRVLMTHYDLDGVSCDILMSKMFDFTIKHKCGYLKVKEKISQGDMMWFDSAVVTDIDLTLDQYLFLSGEYKDRFLYIDHHKPAVDMINDLPKNFSKCIVSTKFSATALILQSFKKLHKLPGIFPYVSVVDAYDKWRFDTHPDQFEAGYDLNSLFWYYGYDDFYDRFSNNLSLEYTSKENEVISEHRKKRDEALAESDKTDFGNSSLLVLNPPSNYINDYSLVYHEYDFYYMVYKNSNDNMVISVRSQLDYVDIGIILRQVRNEFDIVLTAGGHPKAGGADLDGRTSFDDILTVVERINILLEETVVPF